MSIQIEKLPNGRLHMQQGPIDLIIGAEGNQSTAYEAAAARFETVLTELVGELPELRQPFTKYTSMPMGEVAGRMHKATKPYEGHGYLTRMAAVAGAVADTVLEAMTSAADVNRASVNNGGDIAFYLAPGQRYSVVIAAHCGEHVGRIRVTSDDPVRGIATSGRHGRSLSLGIADSVTVLARTAAEADIAATLIANAVDLPGHPGITRKPACEVRDETDLGDLPVVTQCRPLTEYECEMALASGEATAQSFFREGLIAGAALMLQGMAVTLGHALIDNRTLVYVGDQPAPYDLRR